MKIETKLYMETKEISVKERGRTQEMRGVGRYVQDSLYTYKETLDCRTLK